MKALVFSPAAEARAIALSSPDFWHVLCGDMIFPWKIAMNLSPVPYFAGIAEPRRETKNRKHRLSDIPAITLYGVMVGLDD